MWGVGGGAGRASAKVGFYKMGWRRAPRNKSDGAKILCERSAQMKHVRWKFFVFRVSCFTQVCTIRSVAHKLV